MDIYAEGKNIPTYAFGSLFTQGEHYADTIRFFIDRHYNGHDLLECDFAMRGLTEDGWEIMQIVYPTDAGDDKVMIEWWVADSFTLNSGRLLLELRATKTVNDTALTIIKYIMQPVSVRPTPNGKNGPLPDTAEQVVSAITDAAAAGAESISQASESVSETIREGAELIDSKLKEMQQVISDYPIAEVMARLDHIEADTAIYLARPEVIPVTRSQYDSMTHKQNALYVITKEDQL